MNPRILIAIEETLVATDLQHRLDSLGFEVVGVASSRQEALSLASMQRPDLVLVGIRPQNEEEGLAVAEQIRQQHRIPVVLLKPLAEDATAQPSKADETYGCICGPFGNRELKTVIQMAIRAHRAEEAASASEQRCRLLLSSVTDYLYTVEIRDGQPVSTTHGGGCVAVTSYTPEEYAANGYLWFEMIHPDDRKTVLQHAQAAMRGEATQPLEHRIGHKSGAIRWVRNTLVPRRDAEGKLIACDGLVSDITERKRVEDELRKSEARFRMIVENINDALYIHDFEGNIKGTNENACRMLGYTAQEFSAGGLRLIDSPEDMAKTAERMARLLQDGALEFDGEHVRKDGTRVSVSVSARIVSQEGKGIIQGIVRDITERKRAELALKESEFLLRKSQAVARLGSYQFDVLSGKWVSSLVLDQVFGIGPGYPKDVNGWIALVHPAHKEEMRRHLREHVLAQRNRFEKEYRIIRPSDGQERWVFGLGDLEFGADGNPIRMIGTIQDVTERKRMEEELRRQQEDFQTIFDTAPDIIFYLDEAHRVIRANRAAAAVLNRPLEAIIGRTTFELFPKEAASFVADDNEVIRSGLPKLDIIEEYSLPSGELAWAKTHKLPYRDKDGNVAGVIVFAQDITAQKVADEKLREQERRFRSLIEHSTDLISILREDGVFTYLSPSVERLLGYRPEDLVGQSAVALIHPEDRPTIAQAGQRAIQGQWTGRFEIVRIRHRDGSWRTFESVGNLIAKDAIGGRQVVVNSRDVTEREELEDQLRQAQKMEAIGQLAGGIAHDFNNLLTVIQGNASFLELPTLTPEQRADALKEVFRSVQRAADLTRQLLTFSRRREIAQRDLDLNQVLAGLTKMLHRLIGEHIALATQYAREGAYVHADEGMMEQVVVNLVVNARDAMPRGGDLLIATQQATLDEKQARLNVSARPGDFVRLTVSDTGTGIAPEHLPRIFEPFFTTKEMGKGSGLGLATAFGIVRQHDGWIEVESHPGIGTKFHVFLPRLDSLSKSAGQANAAPVPRGTETILLVEDEPGVRTVAREALMLLGYRVLEAVSGPEALQLWREHSDRIDLVLTDLVMPGGMNGCDLSEILLAERPSLKVAYVSGFSDDVVSKGVPFVRGVNFLPKPYLFEELAQFVRQRLDHELEPRN